MQAPQRFDSKRGTSWALPWALQVAEDDWPAQFAPTEYDSGNSRRDDRAAPKHAAPAAARGVLDMFKGVSSDRAATPQGDRPNTSDASENAAMPGPVSPGRQDSMRERDAFWAGSPRTRPSKKEHVLPVWQETHSRMKDTLAKQEKARAHELYKNGKAPVSGDLNSPRALEKRRVFVAFVGFLEYVIQAREKHNAALKAAEEAKVQKSRAFATANAPRACDTVQFKTRIAFDAWRGVARRAHITEERKRGSTTHIEAAGARPASDYSVADDSLQSSSFPTIRKRGPASPPGVPRPLFADARRGEDALRNGGRIATAPPSHDVLLRKLAGRLGSPRAHSPRGPPAAPSSPGEVHFVVEPHKSRAPASSSPHGFYAFQAMTVVDAAHGGSFLGAAHEKPPQRHSFMVPPRASLLERGSPRASQLSPRSSFTSLRSSFGATPRNAFPARPAQAEWSLDAAPGSTTGDSKVDSKVDSNMPDSKVDGSTMGYSRPTDSVFGIDDRSQFDGTILTYEGITKPPTSVRRPQTTKPPTAQSPTMARAYSSAPVRGRPKASPYTGSVRIEDAPPGDEVAWASFTSNSSGSAGASTAPILKLARKFALFG
ncbi:hypothetical protein M885DRAFT_541630 [Pelagophyceae sp. CCMP2097]|nr:hypothetical protein M885DRAFT_541630 [Pelagophyceae sp. CCMP2097]